MQKKIALILSLSAILLTGACAPKEEAAPEPAPAPAPEVVEEVAPVTAMAVLQPRADAAASGMVRFTEAAGGVLVEAEVTGAAPGMHGLHLHELGDCSAEDFTSAGGHFNPTDAPHGSPSDEMRHAGDFGNIEIGEDGAGTLQLTTAMLTVADGPNTVVGRAVILHEDEDDLESQPTGAAGGRIACGVVMLAGEMMEETEEPMEGAEVDG